MTLKELMFADDMTVEEKMAIFDKIIYGKCAEKMNPEFIKTVLEKMQFKGTEDLKEYLKY